MGAGSEPRTFPLLPARAPAGAYRAARWAWSAIRRLRRDLPLVGLGAGVLPPPDLPGSAEVGVWAVVNRLSPTCLERALVAQAWLAAHGEPRDVIVGVRVTGSVSRDRSAFAAHAWIEGGEPESEAAFVRLHRLSPALPRGAQEPTVVEPQGDTPTPGVPALPRHWAAAAGALHRRAQRRQVDRWTGEAFTAFGAAGVDAVLLKGPAVARWLYPDDPDARSYCDVDALVSPVHHLRAEQVLFSLGFVVSNHPKWLLPHARRWVRTADGAKVDLHRTMHAMELISAERVWDEVSAGAERCEVAGVEVAIPGPAMRTLHAVLHVESGEDRGSQASEDLRRAIARVDLPTWQGAAALARRLGIDEDMGARLRVAAGGSALADALDLPEAAPLRTEVISGIERGELPPPLFFLATLAAMSTWGSKARWLLRRQFPDRRYMEARYSVAGHGLPGLVAAYGVRAVHSGVRLPGLLRRWARYKRDREQAGTKG